MKNESLKMATSPIQKKSSTLFSLVERQQRNCVLFRPWGPCLIRHCSNAFHQLISFQKSFLLVSLCWKHKVQEAITALFLFPNLTLMLEIQVLQLLPLSLPFPVVPLCAKPPAAHLI